jgi:NADPH2:quinone reductase
MLKIGRTHFSLYVSRNMSTTMKAVRVHKFGGPEVLQVEEVPVPKPGDKDVLIKVHAVGVNPVETYMRAGLYPVKPQLPYTPGKDAAGVVAAVGASVKKFKVGDRVFCTRESSGTYAEYCVNPEKGCWILPDRLSFEQGAGIGVPFFTAYRSLFQRAHAKPAGSLLVHGASGAVGLASVQLARAYGMKVYGTAGTEEGMKLVKSCGAHHVFNHRNPEYTKELVAATNGQGFDVIMEMLANINLSKDTELLKMGGTVVVIGSRGKVEIDPRFLMGKDAGIIGMNLGIVSCDRDWEDMGAGLTAGFENGTLTPIVDKEYPLSKAGDAHRDIIESSGAKGNLILKIN